MAERSDLRGPGNLESFRALFPFPLRTMPRFLGDLGANYGSISSFALPWKKFIFLNDPAAIKDVLVTQQHMFHKSQGAQALRPMLGNGLVTSEDPLHRQMRRVVQPAFHRKRITGYGETMLEYAREFTATLRYGEQCDIHHAMSELTLRIAGRTLFGADTGVQSEAVREALNETLGAFPNSIGPVGSLIRRLPLPSTLRFERARKTLDTIVYGLIDERRRTGEDRGDALSMLLEMEDAESEFRPDDEQVRDEVMTLFLAGHETTANALTWTLYLLAKHPEIEARLHAEVDALGEIGDPLEALGRLPYALRVIRESMRIYPPVWLIGRESQRAFTLLDRYKIPTGTTMLISPLVLHRTASLYPDPMRFDPDRWLGGDLPPFAYVPFGGGARRCIGEEFAWMEAALLLATLSNAARFTMEAGVTVEMNPLVTLRPKGPVPMKAIARK